MIRLGPGGTVGLGYEEVSIMEMGTGCAEGSIKNFPSSFIFSPVIMIFLTCVC